MKTGAKLYWTGLTLSADVNEAWRGPREQAEAEETAVQKYAVTTYDYPFKINIESETA